ncbi:MAG: Hint domain-containing protein [Pseudomonadota bacterium]
MVRPPGAERSAFSVPVFRCEDFTVTSGANLGDPVSFAAELDLDDTYEVRVGAERHRLSLAPGEGGKMRIARGSEVGRLGAHVCVDCCMTLMSHAGYTTDVLILVELLDDRHAAAIYALPLAALTARVEYTLVGIDTETAHRKFAQAACVSFTRGTRITLASGQQKPVESLAVGDRLLTRDDGAQTLRWIGHSTMRAVGDFAPVLIRSGTLNNAADLRVSPDHRLFVYQRSDKVGAGRSELLVRARHLIDGENVVQETGGFVDYYQLLFDTHQIIYAEGIAAETLLLDRRTRPALPRDLGDKLTRGQPGHASGPHLDFELHDGLLRPDLASLLKGASIR